MLSVNPADCRERVEAADENDPMEIDPKESLRLQEAEMSTLSRLASQMFGTGWFVSVLSPGLTMYTVLLQGERGGGETGTETERLRLKHRDRRT